jgi:cell wall-associated NlpC family hydrolase
MSHWAQGYIGKLWRVAADGPDAFDCWGLVVDIQRQLYGRHLETIYVEPENLRSLIKTIQQHPIRQHWHLTDHPQEGDVVLLRQSRHPVHVGVWLGVDGGGVLHCARESGVVFQDKHSLLLSGWKIEGIYSYADSSSHSPQSVPP